MSPPDRGALVVVGGGVAGATAALTISRHGLPVTLVDEQPQAGGQIFRAPTPYARRHVPPNHEFAGGDRLRALLAGSRVETRPATRVWGVSPRMDLDVLGPDGIDQIATRALVVANGATERVLPFPGWTDPRVIGLAGASILLRNAGTLPGRRVVVAGAGPLLFSVAHQVMELGGDVVAVVDAGRSGDWLRLGTALMRDPARLRLAVQWMTRLRLAGIPIHHRAHIAAVHAATDGLSVAVAKAGRPGVAFRYDDVDAVACGHGLKPATLLTRTLGARHRFDGVGGYWEPETDFSGRTSRAGLYATGDAAGIRGAAVARLRGLITGHAVALDQGAITARDFARLTRHPRMLLRRLDHVSRTMLPLLNASAPLFRAIPDDAIVCRCERVRAATLREATATGARDLNQVKAWTRCGMGPCQGRMCEDGARGVLAASCDLSPEEAGSFTPRTPFFPLPLAALTGTFAYSDIPLPKAAPL
ncbi:BFD domain protein (2Fe-2S)-binding domain protein [Gluconacetobacter diazotrophicus PA1 5]|uniref:FAD/NAD(P)-dependent oxidoreductase n=1 Tax=Gluconacetobacter diazotrophicus TaxID=33996 RepID=UPI000173BE99|nr:NAD(P)/FAD-dependent oxidoreductase [Gluconacetobacter diazotrophicus]ACI50713.1 BFD domain protein (2Fe-2S)-binding domain protein [Gluconacetobacter diazotrophicus PA1 5]